MSAMAYRTYLGLRCVPHIARSNFVVSRNYYADNAVTIGTSQERNSESFQVIHQRRVVSSNLDHKLGKGWLKSIDKLTISPVFQESLNFSDFSPSFLVSLLLLSHHYSSI